MQVIKIKRCVSMLRVSFLLLVNFIFVLPSFSDSSKEANTLLLNHIHCEEQVFKALGEWNDFYEWKKVNSLNGIQIVESQAMRNGPIVRLEITKDSSLLTKRSGNRVQSKLFEKKNCQITQRSTKQSKNLTKINRLSSFMNDDLEKVLNKSRLESSSGIIYSWSPNMNLSVVGAREITEISKKLGLELILLHDSRLSSEEIKPFKIKNSLSMRSRILMDKGMEIHFPSIIVYRNGILDRYSRPGYDNAESLVKRVLK